MSQIEIIKIEQLPLDELEPLLVESRLQGFDFLDRLVDDFASGANRFDRPGEALFTVYEDGRLIAIGGLNQDPYLPDAEAGRVRRVYVLSAWRRRGVGQRLMQHIIVEAQRHYRLLTLRTMTDDASAFYCALGFHTEPAMKGATHHLVLQD